MEKKSKTDRATAEANYERTQKKAKDAAIAASEYEKQARAVDEKTARLKALRLERDAASSSPAEKFQPSPRRQRQPVKKVVIAAEMAQKYEELAQEREVRHRNYGTHLPPDKGK